jgi:hypothetical protein
MWTLQASFSAIRRPHTTSALLVAAPSVGADAKDAERYRAGRAIVCSNDEAASNVFLGTLETAIGAMTSVAPDEYDAAMDAAIAAINGASE